VTRKIMRGKADEQCTIIADRPGSPLHILKTSELEIEAHLLSSISIAKNAPSLHLRYMQQSKLISPIQ
jgi:hypothetical protein